ncbi:hypothetical protein M5D96_013234 [Drosophila gunungcola]|uniref:Uncharacterized protein n=2 Tax=Drosophila gunungcola TaxID=103775 RepID=A0A9P9YCF7_9MUSC|nr:hypothetical protein M5D96_013234 [Drosophila gunungcola]
MAFMMPVMKNNYDIYKDTRSRKTSECSNASSNGTTALATALGTPALEKQQQRRRKVSECKSESFATSPSHGQLGVSSAHHRMQMQRCHSSRAFPRNASRSSHGSMQQIVSPTRSSPPSRSNTASALERQAAAQAAALNQKQQPSGAVESSSNDYTKFHMRLVDKLRKSFRKDSGKRSAALLSINNNNCGGSWEAKEADDSNGRSPGHGHVLGESSAASTAVGGECSAAISWKKAAAISFSESRTAGVFEESGAAKERERSVVSRLGQRFRRYCKLLSTSNGNAAAEDVAETSAEVSSLEQLTGSRGSTRSRRRRSSSIGSASSRLKMRLRRCTSSPG